MASIRQWHNGYQVRWRDPAGQSADEDVQAEDRREAVLQPRRGRDAARYLRRPAAWQVALRRLGERMAPVEDQPPRVVVDPRRRATSATT